MRHKVAGWKLGRNTAHRRSLLRNLVTSLIIEERIETTIPKAKAMRPHVEKMITLGKRGDLSARRLAGSYLMTKEAVTKLFDTIAPRFGDRNGGYLRIVRTTWQKGDGAEKAFIELLGSEKVLDEKREKRAEARAKRVAEANDGGTALSRSYSGGTDLSGGQWQRVALARALVAVERGARLLILDEPSAQLDVRGEAELFTRDGLAS